MWLKCGTYGKYTWQICRKAKHNFKSLSTLARGKTCLDEEKKRIVERLTFVYFDGDSRQVKMKTISRNGKENVIQDGRPEMSNPLDELLKSLGSSSPEGQISHNSSQEQLACPSFEARYVCSNYRQVLPSTADILRYFKDLPSKPSRVEVVDESKRPDPSISLSELYFPSKKHVDSSSVQKIQEQSGDESQPVGPTKINRGKMLPNTDLSRLDSTSLLKNLDAALADISRSANPMAVPSKKDRQCLEMDSAKRSKSLLFKLPTREKPSRNQKSSGRAVKTDTAEDLSSSKHDKCSHALCSGYCSEESSNLSSASDDRAENPSMFITLMRKKQENVSNVLGKQSGEISGLHLGDSKSLLSAAHFSARSSEQPSRVEACETKPKDLFGHLEIAGLEDSCNPLQSIQSGQNPLLSCEKLGQWMDSLAGSSTASYRAKPGDLEASPCRQRASSKSKTEIWWQSTDQIPNYLSTRSLGPALPDYGSIWTQVDDYSDSHEQSPCVISSSEKSDFSCSPEISLSSSTRISSFDYSCSSLDPLASSTRLAMLKDPCASTQTLDSTGIRT